MRYAVADCRISSEIEHELSAYADKVLRLPPHSALASPVASHPDMLLWNYRNRIITFADYLKTAKDVFDALERIGYEIVADAVLPTSVYPFDIPLNCALVGNKIIANKKYASKLIIGTGLEILHTRQGYAKCATVTLSDNAVISADKSVCQVAKENGIDALLIADGHIRLDGYSTGFIGGCTGVTSNEILFTGNVFSHPDGQKISDFCYGILGAGCS